MDKYLIINADDYGSFYGANLAVQELFEKGGITSSTVMTPCAWAPHACAWAAKHPEFAVGVHLTNTSEWDPCRWGPLMGNAGSLADENGYLWKTSKEFEENADMDEVIAEARAQLNLAQKLGLNPSHWDNHMGTLYGISTGRFELLEMILALSAEVGLPFRFPAKSLAGLIDQNGTGGFDVPIEAVELLFGQIQSFIKSRGVICPDYLIPHSTDGPQCESYDKFRDYVFTFAESFPLGVTETFLHPCTDTGEITAVTGKGRMRLWEYKLFGDPGYQRHLKDCGIQTISYRDLAKMRG